MSDPVSITLRESEARPYGLVGTARQHAVTADEPGAVGGADSGPNPWEHVAVGLAACTAITIRMVANRKGWPLDDIEVTATQEFAVGPDGRKQAQFTRTLTFHGALDAAQRAFLLQMAEKCPVSLALKAGAPIITTLTDH
ncbi:MAG: OsmC family peroxiredoxin [Alphaproteobacteria bacterium]|nr:OsmC family protein [Alphaproteobacteria bacterium]TAD90229.1 MAG: OsmC family peroxiredoxin [Alphaproteobacteria bacterium]